MENDSLKSQLRNLIEIFIDKILNAETGHLELFLMKTGTVNIALFPMDMTLKLPG